MTLAGAAGLLTVWYVRGVRPWHLRWGATADEARRAMPGDDLVGKPTLCATRAVTIAAPPEAVWPWLVQMGGYTRAGWYSYDRFDNGGVRSAERIVPELQDLHVGDAMLTSRTAGFTVRAIDAPRSLVLELEHDGSHITSVLLLHRLLGGKTRLVCRIRAWFRPRHWPFAVVFDVGDFLFMRKQLLGIKRRAERGPGRAPAIRGVPPRARSWQGPPRGWC